MWYPKIIMATTPYDFTFVLRKQLQRKILFIISIVILVSVLICLFLSFVLFPIRVNSPSMEPDFI